MIKEWYCESNGDKYVLRRTNAQASGTRLSDDEGTPPVLCLYAKCGYSRICPDNVDLNLKSLRGTHISRGRRVPPSLKYPKYVDRHFQTLKTHGRFSRPPPPNGGI